MRKLITSLIFAIFITASGFAQQPPNASFENWANVTTWGFLPTGWNGTNYRDLGYTGVTRESDDPFDGNYYVKMEAKTAYYGNSSETIPGGLTLADIEYVYYGERGNPKGKAGIAYAHRPTRLYGYFKYTKKGNDNAIMRVVLTKWNGTKRDTIGYIQQTVTSSVADWTKFDLPIDYRSTATPDTLNIIFTTSYFNSVTAGSILCLDKLEFLMQDTFDVDYTISGNQCSGATLQFEASSSTLEATGWEWSMNGNVLGTGKTFNHTFPEVTEATNYSLTLKGTSSIGPDEITKTVTINPPPNVQIDPADPYICPKSTVTLTASGAKTYAWSYAGSTNQSITVTPANYSSYTVTGTDEHGCVNTASTLIMYARLDTTTLNRQICSSEPYDFFGTALDAAGTYYHNLQSKISGCDSTIKLVLTVTQAPALSISADKNSVCTGGEVELTATAGFSSYDWGSGAVASNKLNVTPAQTTTYTLVAQNSTGCSVTASITITVGETLSSTETFNICEGDEIEVFDQKVSDAGTFDKTFKSVDGCDSLATVIVKVFPIPEVFDVQGSGKYNADTETGLPVSLSSSETGVTYKLIKDSNVINTLDGTGAKLEFGIYPEGIYTVEAENVTAGCAKAMNGHAEISITTGSSIIDSNNNVKVYPNPTEDKVYIDVPGKCDLRILSSSGQIIVAKKNFTSNYVDLSNYHKGIYFIEVIIDGQKTTEKILKQ